MIARLLTHTRSNAIAYLALVFSLLALAGGAYAAVALPANSVGARQIRNGAISPVKLNHANIGGSIRDWASVDSLGGIISSSGHAHVTVINPGAYQVTWGRGRLPRHCIPLATAYVGSISASLGSSGPVTVVDVHTTGNGLMAPQAPFTVAVVC